MKIDVAIVPFFRIRHSFFLIRHFINCSVTSNSFYQLFFFLSPAFQMVKKVKLCTRSKQTGSRQTTLESKSIANVLCVRKICMTEEHSKTIKLKPPEQKVPAWQAKWRQINKLSFHSFEASVYLNVITEFHYVKLKIGWSFVCGLLFYHLLRIAYVWMNDWKSWLKNDCSLESSSTKKEWKKAHN